MAETVITRYRECNTLLTQVVVQLRALSNFTAQRMCAEGALRRSNCSHSGSPTPGHSSDHAHDVVTGSQPRKLWEPLDGLERNNARCACGPLGVLLQFPAAVGESILSQHDHDITSLIRSITITTQTWQKHLESAKRASSCLFASADPSGPDGGPTQSAELSAAGCSRFTAILSTSQIQYGAMGLIATLSAMSAILRELVLALRSDAAKEYDSGAGGEPLKLADLVNRHATTTVGACGEAPVALPTSNAGSYVDLVDELPDWLQREWERVATAHLCDESRILLAM